MSSETIFAAFIVAYVGGVVLTGMVVAFGTEAFYWDGEHAITTSLLWPLLVVIFVIASPFLFAGWLGRTWRKATWDKPSPSKDTP